MGDLVKTLAATCGRQTVVFGVSVAALGTSRRPTGIPAEHLVVETPREA